MTNTQPKMTRVQEAAIWAAEEYERRTRALATGEVTGAKAIHIACPSTRVTWHEICHKFEMKVMGPNDRVDFQPLFEKEMRKRHLIQVLRGKMKADQWLAKYGKKS